MILDIDMLRSFYASYSESVAQAKATVKRPLTYAEKVLFAHLFDPTQSVSYTHLTLPTKEVWNMLISDLIVWRCRMRRLRWLFFSS